MELKILQIDLARQKENIDFIKQYFQFAKRCGYNAILLYLEFCVRTEDTAFFDAEETYSMEEMAEIVDCIEGLGLQAIPNFENLAHLENLLKYDNFSDLAECPQGGNSRFDGGMKNGSCGCVSNPKLLEITNRYMQDVLTLFKSEYVLVGMDEPFDFADCERCQALIRAGKTKNDLFLEHVLKTRDFLRGLGKRLIMGDDFFEYFDILENLPRDIIFATWCYVFMADDCIPGHWVNRVKKDTCRRYEELGFEYILQSYAHHSSCAYNANTLYDNYGKIYKPKGINTSVWCHSESFYFSSYPYIAYAIKKFNGEIKSREDAIDVYKQFFDGNEEIANIIYSMNLVAHYGPNLDFSVRAERDSFVKYLHREELAYFLPKLKAYKENNPDNDVFTDLYNNTLMYSLELDIEQIGTEYYNALESGTIERKDLIKRLNAIKAQISAIKEDGDKLWGKYRHGIRSMRNDYERCFARRFALLDKLIDFIENNYKTGVLYVGLMLPDGYATPQGEIVVEYEGGSKSVIYNGAMKHGYATYDVGGTYGFKFLIDNKPVKSVIFSQFGEGALYVTDIRMLIQGQKQIAKEVKVIAGIVEHVENILNADTTFVSFGYEKGIDHINDLQLSKIRSTVELTF